MSTGEMAAGLSSSSSSSPSVVTSSTSRLDFDPEYTYRYTHLVGPSTTMYYIRHSGCAVHVVPAMVVVAVAHSLAENLENVGSCRERKRGGGEDECGHM